MPFRLLSISRVVTISALFLVGGALWGKEPVTLFMIGDSTMSTYGENRYPRTGWGQMMPLYFKEGIRVENRARSGRSSKSFIGEGFWDEVLEDLKVGDFLVVQFGHNDAKLKDPNRYTLPWEEYTANLTRYVLEAREKGAIPILATSICRRRFDDEGNWQASHGEYPAAARKVAEEMDVPMIDLQALTRDLLVELGEEKSILLYHFVIPRAYENYPKLVEDNTHLSDMGSRKIASLFAEEVERQGLPLADYLK